MTRAEESLLAENILYSHRISQLQREIEIYERLVAINTAEIRDNCEHKWTREYTCEPCGPTQYYCNKCGQSK